MHVYQDLGNRQLVSFKKNPWTITFTLLGNFPLALPLATPLLRTIGYTIKSKIMSIKYNNLSPSVKSNNNNILFFVQRHRVESKQEDDPKIFCCYLRDFFRQYSSFSMFMKLFRSHLLFEMITTRDPKTLFLQGCH
jgi:hypothetical protein